MSRVLMSGPYVYCLMEYLLDEGIELKPNPQPGGSEVFYWVVLALVTISRHLKVPDTRLLLLSLCCSRTVFPGH